MNNITALPINKTVVFYCPFEGNNCLVRTGTNDNSSILSFLNAVLYACSRTFKNLDTTEKFTLIKKVKDTIISKITKNQWPTNGLDIFKKMFNESVRDFYKSLNEYDDVSNMNNITKKITHKLIRAKKDYELFKIIT